MGLELVSDDPGRIVAQVAVSRRRNPRENGELRGRFEGLRQSQRGQIEALEVAVPRVGAVDVAIISVHHPLAEKVTVVQRDAAPAQAIEALVGRGGVAVMVRHLLVEIAPGEATEQVLPVGNAPVDLGGNIVRVSINLHIPTFNMPKKCYLHSIKNDVFYQNDG